MAASNDKDSMDCRSIAIVPASSRPEIEAIRRLFLEYSQELGLDLEFQRFTAELRHLPGVYAPPRGRLLLARSGDAVAGCVALRPLSEVVCEMKRLFVRPVFRGAGVGRLLAERILSEARRAGYEEMRLDTLASMTAARRLYESLGFQHSEAYYPNPLPDVIYLRLPLQG